LSLVALVIGSISLFLGDSPEDGFFVLLFSYTIYRLLFRNMARNVIRRFYE